MYRIIDNNGTLYNGYQYADEAEYGKMIVANAETIFGSRDIYFDIKKKIGKSKEGAAIPDGYYLDLKFHEDPILYFVEVELSDHVYTVTYKIARGVTASCGRLLIVKYSKEVII